MQRDSNGRSIGRREFLRRGGAAALGLGPVGSLLALGGCGDSDAVGGGTTPGPLSRPRAPSGQAREVRLVAEVGEVNLGPLGRHRTWLYNGEFPGPELRVREGERLRVTLENRLPEGTTTHWHGVPVPNAMDGVPGVTQEPVPPGDTFVYEYVAEPAGSYLYHSHAGLQLDRGLLGPLIIEERTPHVAYDREYTLIFDDSLPGEPETLDGGGMMGMMMGGGSDPEYKAFLVNGRSPGVPPALEVSRGERVRLRLLNLASATTFHLALAGHRMAVTHTDGRPVRPVEVDSLLLGMGERYDVVVEATNPGAWNLVAASLRDGPAPARAVVRYRGSRQSAPPEGQVPAGLRGGRVLALEDLVSVEDAAGAGGGGPDRSFDLTLSGGMMMSEGWSIDGQRYPDAEPLEIREGERVRVRMMNMSMMSHPTHLHGHFFRVGQALKDTVLVPPHMGRRTLEFTADNPGEWFFHCHNLYHMESGMARVVRYA